MAKKRIRKLIAFDGRRWYVRRIRNVTHNFTRDEKVYRCDKPYHGKGFKRLVDVPEIAKSIRQCCGLSSWPTKS